jgi:hypothetical protein
MEGLTLVHIVKNPDTVAENPNKVIEEFRIQITLN